MSRLAALQGGRFIASLWVVCRHSVNDEKTVHTVFGRPLGRAFIAVSYFATLSGFITQCASGRTAANSFTKTGAQ